MWLVGVGGIYGCGLQEVDGVESIGVVSGCGCKEVYRFPHTTYPYSFCICSFLQTPLVSVLFCSSIPTFCSFKKIFFVLVYNSFSTSLWCIANVRLAANR